MSPTPEPRQRPPSGNPRWRPEWAPFRPRLLDTLKGYNRQTFARDLVAGLTVGMVALPLAMAFAVASGVKPEQGIFTAIVAGFLISALGGSNVQIGGPAGAFIVIVYGIVQRYGLTNLLIATALSGMLLFAMGALKLGALVRYMPVTIIIGFTNGIAVVIGMSQLKDLLGLQLTTWPVDFFSQVATLARHASEVNLWALGVGLGSLAVVALWPRLSSLPSVSGPLAASQRWRRWAGHLPGTVVALTLATVLTVLLDLPIDTIGSRFGGIPQGLPQLSLPPFSWQSAQQLVIPTLTLAFLGAIESLICARVADNLSTLPKHDPNQELMAQGVANMVGPLFGCLP
ncbi:MAG: SulP family inorganic anion transporter, partial [Pseudomonadota bacterium]